MQNILYFCAVKRRFLYIVILCCTQFLCAEESLNFQLSTFNYTIDEIVSDIYSYLTEFSEVDYEQLQTDLYALHDAPIDLNHTSDEELSQLYFLSPQQIDDILAYADKHPFESLYELRMIQSLEDYEIRDLLPFVRVGASTPENKMYAREVFAHATHEITTRVDARNIEAFEGTDPMFAQGRYRFDYHRKVTFGAQLRRPAGGRAQDLQYGAYLQLRDIAPHLHTMVGGNFQASFGQGLVLAPVFHAGKSMYVASAGQNTQGLRYYSSVDGAGLHGAGTTLRWEWGKATRLDASVLYSFNHYNDTTWRHLIGANLTFRHKRLELQLTGIGSIYSDSIHPYRNAKYNRHYFRGRDQAVLGASFRYNHGWFDLFGEIATNQKSQITNSKWGIGTIVGCRFYPTSGVSLLALYRYYSPWFDNQLGYAFSETSRINDENGGYLGFDITRLNHWRFLGYGDVFYFEGYKYGLGNDTCTLGYDALAEVQYHQSPMANHQWSLSLRARAKMKGTSTYSLRAMFDWQRNGWSLRTTADANITPNPLTTNPLTPYGVSLAQDIAYDFQSPMSNIQCPIALKFRAQFFDAREWSNRIYLYEHDVLYAYSIPATYGLGGRFYLCLRWQIIPQLALYFRASETVYAQQWAAAHDRPQSRTDFHLLLRAKL